MITPHEYYTTSLYPLQDGILKIVTHLNTPFYLTGGTALSRCFFHHRYSDDLDFFVNADPGIPPHGRPGGVFHSKRRPASVTSRRYFSGNVVATAATSCGDLDPVANSGAE